MNSNAWRSPKLLIFLILFFSFLCLSLSAQTRGIQFNPDEFLKVERLSERVLIVGMGIIYYDAVTAIATEKGIVVIDAGTAPSITAEYRIIIEKEFGCSNFIYLINTHDHFDHTNGNQIFSDAIIIGHDLCASEMTHFWSDSATIDNAFYKSIGRINNRRSSLEVNSDMWKFYNCLSHQFLTFQGDLEGDFRITPPSMTFSDRMSLDLGDVTLNLIYFGEAHTKSDIMIYVPEEKMLFIGDLFEKDGEPDFQIEDNGHSRRWLEVMDWVFQPEMEIERIIYGHGLIFSKEDLNAFKKNVEQMHQEFINEKIK